MRRTLLCLLLSALAAQGGTTKPPPVTIRLHAEGKQTDGEQFAKSIQLAGSAQKTFIQTVPIISEKDIEAFLPFPGQNGSIGLYLKLDYDGTAKLEQHTASSRDSLVVALVNGRVASAMRVGKKITDGIVYIPGGVLPSEILEMEALYPIMGREKEFDEQKKKAELQLKAQKQLAKAAAKASPTPKVTATTTQ